MSASSEKAEDSGPIIEKKCVQLDLENLICAQDLAECKEEQSRQVLKLALLEEKIYQLDALNKVVKGLNDQIKALKEDNGKLVNLNLRLQGDSASALKNVRAILDEKSGLLVEARLEKNALLQTIKDLKVQQQTLRLDNEKFTRINAQLLAGRDVAVKKAYEIVGQKAKTVIRSYTRLDSPKIMKQLEADKVALKAENERLVRTNAQLEAKSKELFLKADAIDYRAKGYDALSYAMQRLNHQVILLKKEKNSLKSQLDAIKEDLSTERASIYREVGAAAAQAGLLEEAINAYQLSLKLDPKDPMTHYYLGLLYSKQWNDAVAMGHFKKYLALVPTAENRNEVEYFMSIMLNRSDLVIK